MQFRICCADAAANGFYDRHGHTVAGLLVCLRIGVDSEDLVNLILAETLQTETLPRHQPSDSAAAQDNVVCVRCVHRMGNACKHTPAARIAAREAEINRIAFMRFLIAFLRCFLNVENAGILPLEVGKGAVLPGMQTSGVRRDLRIALCQIYKVESGLSAGVLCAGDSGRIIEDYLLWLTDARGSSPSTYNQRLCAIHAFFDYVMMEEPSYMEHCLQILKIPSMVAPTPQAKYMTPENLKLLLSMPDVSTKKGRRHLVLLTVLYDTAARVSELVNIRLRDIRLDFPAVITLHGKGGKVRTVPLMKQTAGLLQGYLQENHIDLRATPELPLFWNGRRHKLTRSGVTYIVQKYAEMAQELSTGMPTKISPHVFRHTKAMHLVQANVNPVYIKDYLGHADISTTEVYARADNEAKRAVLEKATAHLDLPKASHWEQDTELIDWLSSLG